MSAGTYTKVGRLVTVTFGHTGVISLTATTGNAYITGLPFSNVSIRSAGSFALRETVVTYDVLTDGPIVPVVSSSDSSIDLIAIGSANDYTKNIPLNKLVNTGGGTSNYITLTVTYQTA